MNCSVGMPLSEPVRTVSPLTLRVNAPVHLMAKVWSPDVDGVSLVVIFSRDPGTLRPGLNCPSIQTTGLAWCSSKSGSGESSL